MEMAAVAKYAESIVEYLEQGRLRPVLVVREQDDKLVVLDASGREKSVARELVLIRHPERKAQRGNLAEVLAALEAERAQLAAELDLHLLWEVVREQNRAFTAAELAELFFGLRSGAAQAVMLEALFNDRLFFVRRHMEFLPRAPEQVERLRIQYEKARLRSDEYRKLQALVREVIVDGLKPSAADAAPLIDQLSRYLRNPSTRSTELTTILTQAVPEADPAEMAFEIVDRLGAAPDAPRFAVIGGLRMEFSEEARREAAAATPASRSALSDAFAVAIDDEETLEVDDALSCEPTPEGGLRVWTHIALVADFVERGGAMDKEAAARAATVYLPETTVRMLPEEISCGRASLLEGERRPVLTTEVVLSADGELLKSSIFPSEIRVAAQLDYDRADRILAAAAQNGSDPLATTLTRLHAIALHLRDRRRRAGATLFARVEPKVKVHNRTIEIKTIDNSSPSRQLVAEFMVLSNFVAARFASDNQVAIIYRVQPSLGGDIAMQRPRLSLYPEHHAGVGMDRYAQLSSPLRRYADLVLQRQLLAALATPGSFVYRADELLSVLAAMENVEAEGKELERRAKRYWILRYLAENAGGRPLEAAVTREGASAELLAYATRGTLRGAPNLPTGAKIMVELARVDPLRGWLAFNYLGPASDSPRPAAQ
jgi:exoribonuclease II